MIIKIKSRVNNAPRTRHFIVNSAKRCGNGDLQLLLDSESARWQNDSNHAHAWASYTYTVSSVRVWSGDAGYEPVYGSGGETFNAWEC